MDVQRNIPRERVFSILNDDDSPSFVIRQKQSSPRAAHTKLPSISSFSPRLERPQFLRQEHYQRNSSVSSSGSSSGTPPLLRYDSHSSKSSSGSMDSTPSPITPAYNYNDTLSGPYDSLLRADLGQAYLPPTSSITPFLEQQMMIAPVTSGPLSAFDNKAIPQLPLYPSLPLSQTTDFQTLSTPSLSHHESISSASSSAQSKTSPTTNNNNLPTGKKNKYPCPYAQSHKCQATFTTSGHAARHGKKHTGEKGVHCPICNKAFTRKDNMKQHERTHKNQAGKGSDDSTRSKAAITKEAQKEKSHKKTESQASNQTNKTSHMQSPISEVASLAPSTIDNSIIQADPTFFQEPLPQLILPNETNAVSGVISNSSMYPPLGDDTIMSNSTLPQVDKLDASIQMPPTLIRGFSDLDTLAQAAAADFDPYYQPQF